MTSNMRPIQVVAKIKSPTISQQFLQLDHRKVDAEPDFYPQLPLMMEIKHSPQRVKCFHGKNNLLSQKFPDTHLYGHYYRILL